MRITLEVDSRVWRRLERVARAEGIRAHVLAGEGIRLLLEAESKAPKRRRVRRDTRHVTAPDVSPEPAPRLTRRPLEEVGEVVWNGSMGGPGARQP